MKAVKKLAVGVLCILVSAVAIVLASIPISIYEKPNDLLAFENSRQLVIDNVQLVDVNTGNIVADQQLTIINGQIAAINTAATPVVLEHKFIDANGAFLVPGLFDMHVHLHDRKYLGLYLAHGVTSVRNMRGLPMHLRWKQEIDLGQWLGSNLYTSSPVLDGEKYAHLLQQVVTSPDRARALVSKYQQDGYDFIKAYGYLDKAVFLAIVEQAEALDYPVAKHGPNPVEGAPLGSNAGLQSLEHVEDIFQGPLNFTYDQQALKEWISELKQIDPFVTPTLATFNHLTQLSEHKAAYIDQLPMQTLNPLYKALLGKFSVQRWLDANDDQIAWNKKELAFLLEIVRALDEEGIKLLVGSDAGTMYMPPGSSTHDEIALMQESGLSPLTILQAATVNAATALGVDDQYGSIEPGKIADMVLVASNPLEDLDTLRKPKAVIKEGQWIPESDIQALKKSGESPSSFYVSVGRLLEDLLTRAFN